MSAVINLVTVDDQDRLVLLPVFRGAIKDGFRQIAHAVFVELLEIAGCAPVADEFRGGAEARERFLAPYVEQLKEMMRIVTSSCCEGCGECQEKELWWRMTETARTLAEKNNRLTDIVAQLQQIDIRPATCCQQDC
jgi:hypothetical protein